MRPLNEQSEISIAREKAKWADLVTFDDGTIEIWEDLVRRSAPHVLSSIFMPRLKANSAFTPSSHPTIYQLPENLAAEWGSYRVRWEQFLDLNPRARIATMMSDVSECHSSTSFPDGWEQLVRDWVYAGFPQPADFYVHESVATEAWKGRFLDAVHRAGRGWVYRNDKVNFEWRVG